MSARILSFKELRQLTGLSRSTIWRMERAGAFPKRRQISPDRVGWIESEVLAWMEALPKVA